MWALAGGAVAPSIIHAAGDEKSFPVRAITRGPKFHWFGYYDKHAFDPANRFVLSNEVTFEHRSPRADDEIAVGMIDLDDGDRWIELGRSRAWGWQQGCMLQWVPGTESTVIWNDREADRFVARILDVKTGDKRTIDRPVYALSPDGRWAIGADFHRIQILRPGYGYAGVDDPYADVGAPEQMGVWRIDLKTGQSKLLISLAQLADVPWEGVDIRAKLNWVNHLLVNPDGSRFVFLHRFRDRSDDPKRRYGGGFMTRMITANADGSDLFVLDPSGYTSHFIWRDPAHICAWTRPEGRRDGFYLFKDRTREVTPVGPGKMPHNGHNTYLPGDGTWILNDTYPQGKDRLQQLYLYHVPTDRRIDIGQFHEPAEYKGEWRCDLHPRASRDGRFVTIDSTHGGNGRQVYLVEIGARG